MTAWNDEELSDCDPVFQTVIPNPNPSVSHISWRLFSQIHDIVERALFQGEALDAKRDEKRDHENHDDEKHDDEKRDDENHDDENHDDEKRDAHTERSTDVRLLVLLLSNRYRRQRPRSEHLQRQGRPRRERGVEMRLHRPIRRPSVLVQ